MAVLGGLTLAVGCHEDSALPEGPLVYTGSPNIWTGPMHVSKARAWGLVEFGREGIEATFEQVQLETPLPDGIHAVVRVNLGEPVDIGATEAPPRARLQPLPATIRRPAQIVVWFRADRLGLRYTSASVAIVYSVDGQDYRVTYPQGVTVCSVRDPVQHPECD